MQKTIMFIHGAFMTPLCWEKFLGFFQPRGYKCLAPAWPYRDKPIDLLRNDPPSELARLGVQEIIDHYEKAVRSLEEPPILIGHSFGGMFVQSLLDRGLGHAGVAIHPAPPRGVLPLQWSAIKANSGVLTQWGGWKKIVRMSFPEFQYAFVNTMSPENQKKAYDRYVVPESGRIFFQAAFSLMNPRSPLRINFANHTRSPLLIVAGSKDHIVPAAMNKANLKKYGRSSARTDFREFAGRTHWTIGQEGWEEVTEYIETWLQHL